MEHFYALHELPCDKNREWSLRHEDPRCVKNCKINRACRSFLIYLCSMKVDDIFTVKLKSIYVLGVSATAIY